ncbi:NACHT domain-containing protein [Streptomyces sp. NPDC058426]|uniref:NACHT domain-containing protein n=1 Tax=Streptomyces sp. NPDC058426 TaxID=3346493 RepID=UPI00364B69D5
MGSRKKWRGLAIAVVVVLVMIAVLKFANAEHSNWFEAVSLVVAVLSSPLLGRLGVSVTEDDLSRCLRALEERTEADACRYDDMLGNGQCTLDLVFERQETLGAVDAGAQPQGRLSTIADYYAGLRTGRLVVTGGAGAGKTTLALRLSAALLRDGTESRPVPVRVSLSGWDPGKKGFPQWLVDHIHQLLEVTKASRRQVEDLVRAGRVLPILDDLDRMDPPGATTHTRAARAVCEINRFRTSTGRALLILVCRTDVYTQLRALDVELYQAAHVDLRPVSALGAAEYLNGRAGNRARWAPVVSHLTDVPDGALARAFSGPQYVNQAAAVYEERGDDMLGYRRRQPGELVGLPDEEAVTGELMTDYVRTSLREGDPGLGPKGVERSVKRLGRLARAVSSAGGGQDIVLRDVWRLKERPVLVAEAVLALLFLTLTVVVPLRDQAGLVWIYLSTLGPFVLFQACRKRLPKTKELRLLGLSRPWARGRLWRRFLLGILLPTLLLWAGGIAVGLVADARHGAKVSRYMVPDQPVIDGFVIGFLLALFWDLTFGSILVAVSTSDNGNSYSPRGEVMRDFLAGVAYVGAFFLAHALWCLLRYGPHEMNEHLGNLYPRVATAFALYGWSGVSRRYFLFVLVTRGRLSLRLGAFLQRCQEAGILRRSGKIYQFRQAAYQEWLTSHRCPADASLELVASSVAEISDPRPGTI